MLVHLGSGGDAIDGHEEGLLGLDLGKEMFDVGKDVDKDFFFSYAFVGVIAVVVGAIVDDAWEGGFS